MTKSLQARAIKTARCQALQPGERHPRYFAIMEILDVGERQAKRICQQHGYDPEELVVR